MKACKAGPSSCSTSPRSTCAREPWAAWRPCCAGAFLQPLQGNPLLARVGEWVLDKALAQRELWRAQGLDIPISVNIDATHLQQPDFMARLRTTLARHSPLQAGDLELEILETSALDDTATV